MLCMCVLTAHFFIFSFFLLFSHFSYLIIDGAQSLTQRRMNQVMLEVLQGNSAYEKYPCVTNKL